MWRQRWSNHGRRPSGFQNHGSASQTRNRLFVKGVQGYEKVMIVDDSAFMRKVVTDLLNQLPDIEVTVAARNGKQALDYLTKEAIDLVVMDVEMPVMNGLETLRKMKQQSAIPVIMLSSLTNQETTIEALALGARDFVENQSVYR